VGMEGSYVRVEGVVMYGEERVTWSEESCVRVEGELCMG
jgi:hypothetical protein